MNLYTVHYTAVRFVTSSQSLMETGAHAIIAADGHQAIHSIHPKLADRYPESSGWRLELTAMKIDPKIVQLLVEDWGWVKPQ